MRVSPVAWAFDELEIVKEEAEKTALCTHNHPEGIKGAIVTALAIGSLRSGRRSILKALEAVFYDPTAKYIRGKFDESCQGTVPVALRIVDDSKSFEDAIRLTMAWGGDSDTLGAIVGGMAEALYGIPTPIKNQALEYLPAEMRKVLVKFYNRYIPEYGNVEG